jgi:uncharacterized protein (DUF952 family)
MAEIVHLCGRADWQAAQERGEYRAASLEREGFIHFSMPVQVARTANRFFHGRRDLVLLLIDPDRLRAELRYEPADNDLFPHLYGPLNLDAVVEARDFLPDEAGTFQMLF